VDWDGDVHPGDLEGMPDRGEAGGVPLRRDGVQHRGEHQVGRLRGEDQGHHRDGDYLRDEKCCGLQAGQGGEVRFSVVAGVQDGACGGV